MIPCLSLLMSVSHAFAPDGPDEAPEDGPRPLVTMEPTRIFPVHAPVQRQLARGAAWQEFVTGEGEGWRAIFDEHSGSPHTMWGPGLPVPTDRDDLVEAVQGFLVRNAAVLGVEAGTLVLADDGYHAPSDTWYLHFDERREGVAVYRGGVGVQVKHGSLVLLQVMTTQDVRLAGDWALSDAQAIALATAEGPAPRAVHTETDAVRRLLDRQTPRGRELRRTWMVSSTTDAPLGRWVSFVDAETGELLNVHNDVAFASGVVEGLHHVRNPDPSVPLTVSHIPLAIVDSGTGTASTDLFDGTYTVSDGETYTTTFRGAYLNVIAEGEPEGLLVGTTPNLLWDTNSALQSEIDVYVHTHVVREWGRRVAPSVPMVTNTLEARVDINQVCNASYTPGQNVMRFYSAGSGCNDTGENADVIYHEWGHGFHDTSIVTGSFDRSISEGVADTVAFLLTRDPVIAPYFRTDGSGIREVFTDKIYPQDFNENQGVHRNGLIFGSTYWDLLDRLEAVEGIPQGTESTEQIFAGSLRSGPGVTQLWGAALVADDDDGDLGNGTPHICEIYDVFTQHGVGPDGGPRGLFAIDHVPLERVDAGQDLVVEVDVLDRTGGNCPPAAVTDGRLHYRIDGGRWSDVQLSGTPLAATIAGQPVGSIVEYYVSLGTGPEFFVPEGGVVTPYVVLVGDDLPIACWDFEADDGGFTHALLAGEPTAGADDWQWGNPAGRAQDPADAFSGNFVWGNDLGNTIGQNNFNGEYQNEKQNVLVAPVVSTSPYTDAMLTYRRWLSVEDATYDQAEILVNDAVVWGNRVGSGEEHHIDREWANHVVRLGPAVDRADAQVAWRLTSDGGLSFGGWTIDDVCITVPATPDNRLAIDDLGAEVLSDTEVRLTWTHPAHAPVERVVLVRNFEAFPTGPTDGMVLAEFLQPDLDSAAVFDEVNYDPGDSYYAVYGYDGTDWLSWTIEGFNAVQVELVGGTAPDGWPDYPEPPEDTGVEDTGDPIAPVDTGSRDTGVPPELEDTGAPTRRGETPESEPGDGLLAELCGCSTTQPRPVAALAVVLLALVGWRRRG